MKRKCIDSNCIYYGVEVANNKKRCMDCFNPIYPDLVSGTDTYTIQRFIAGGGMGRVFEAVTSNGKIAAIKQFFPAPGTAQNVIDDNLDRFKRESAILLLAHIHHPAFPQGYGFFEYDQEKWMAMEFISGENLFDYVKRVKALSKHEAMEITMEVAQALHELHELSDSVKGKLHLVHRDIKPENIMREPSGRIRILDLGLTRSSVISSVTQVGRNTLTVGTVQYAPPEQFQGASASKLPFDHRADIYSLAVSMYYLLTEKEFNGQLAQTDWNDRLNQVRANISDVELQGVLCKAIAVHPNRRYSTALEFAQDLARVYELTKPLPVAFQSLKVKAQTVAVLTPTVTPNPAIITPTASVPITQPVAPKVEIIIDLGDIQTTAMEYSRRVRGVVYVNGIGQDGLTVRPVIDDTGGITNGRGTDVDTEIGGDFYLTQDDYTVSLDIASRSIELKVIDSSNKVIGRTEITIKRPWSKKPALQKVGNFVSSLVRPWSYFSPVGWKRIGISLVLIAVSTLVWYFSQAIFSFFSVTASGVGGWFYSQWSRLMMFDGIWWLTRILIPIVIIGLLITLYRNWVTFKPWFINSAKVVGVVILLFFLFVTMIGLSNKNAMIWTIAPYGSVIGWRILSAASRNALDKLYSTFLLAITILWVGLWFYYFYLR